MAHTPGPWRASTQRYAVVADHPVPEISGSDAIDYYGGHLIGESIAPQNIGLISAAPDLLEALKWLHELCIHANPGAFDNGNLDATGSIDEGDVLASKLIGGAQAAIDRAEGRS